MVSPELGGKVFVSDKDNRRILFWNSVTEEFFQSADLVIGQPSYSDTDVNHGEATGVSAKGFNIPWGLWLKGQILYVADGSNNRVVQIPVE